MKMVQLALFIAIIFLMAFTPIGYIKTPGFQITLLVIPVTVGAIILGPGSGAILGGAFGVTSFIQCFGLDPFGAFLLGISPVGTLILCLVPRILMGWLSGIIFLKLRKINKFKNLSYAVSSLSGPILNTVLFMGTFVVFLNVTDSFQALVEKFGFEAGNIMALVITLAGVNSLIEALVCLILGTAIAKALDSFRKKSDNY
jgi:uncharacterized membrane protein